MCVSYVNKLGKKNKSHERKIYNNKLRDARLLIFPNLEIFQLWEPAHEMIKRAFSNIKILNFCKIFQIIWIKFYLVMMANYD